MRVHLLDHLLQRRPGSPRHVVEEDVLRRVRDVDRAIRLVERVLAGGEDRQRLAVRTEARAHRHTGDEIRVRRQLRVQMRLHRVVDRRRRHVVAAGQTLGPAEPAVVIAIVSALVVVPLAIVAGDRRRFPESRGMTTAPRMRARSPSPARSGAPGEISNRLVIVFTLQSHRAPRRTSTSVTLAVRLSYRNSRRTRRAGS